MSPHIPLGPQVPSPRAQSRGRRAAGERWGHGDAAGRSPSHVSTALQPHSIPSPCPTVTHEWGHPVLRPHSHPGLPSPPGRNKSALWLLRGQSWDSKRGLATGICQGSASQQGWGQQRHIPPCTVEPPQTPPAPQKAQADPHSSRIHGGTPSDPAAPRGRTQRGAPRAPPAPSPHSPSPPERGTAALEPLGAAGREDAWDFFFFFFFFFN